MTDDAAKTYIQYRLQRAKEALDEARLLQEANHINTAVNRLYYACFYAASALLYSRGFSSKTHAGTARLFHHEIITAGILSKDDGALYAQLLHARERGDYDINWYIDPGEASIWTGQASTFVTKVTRILQD